MQYIFIGDYEGRVLTHKHELDAKLSKFHTFGCLTWLDAIAKTSQGVDYTLVSEDRFV